MKELSSYLRVQINRTKMYPKELRTLGKCHALPLLADDVRCSLARQIKKIFFICAFTSSPPIGRGGGTLKKSVTPKNSPLESILGKQPTSFRYKESIPRGIINQLEETLISAMHRKEYGETRRARSQAWSNQEEETLALVVIRHKNVSQRQKEKVKEEITPQRSE